MSAKSFVVPGFGCSYVSEFEDAGDHADFSLRFHKHHETFTLKTTAPCLLLPLEAGSASLQVARSSIALGPDCFACLPASATAVITARSHLLKLARITFHPPLLNEAPRHFKFSFEELERALREPAALERSVWIDEVWHRYIFERSIANARDSLAARFCELELLKEAYYRVHAASRHDPTATRDRHAKLSPAVERALGHLERNLHVRELDLDALVAAAGVSKSSLQRAFGKELGESPMRYLWKRRLQEARLLLMTGRFTVSEVAIHVGYADVSSFSQAYALEFGEAPSKTRES